MGRTNDTLEHKKNQVGYQHDLGHQQISQHMSNSTTFEGWSEEEVAKYKGNIKKGVKLPAPYSVIEKF